MAPWGSRRCRTLHPPRTSVLARLVSQWESSAIVPVDRVGTTHSKASGRCKTRHLELPIANKTLFVLVFIEINYHALGGQQGPGAVLFCAQKVWHSRRNSGAQEVWHSRRKPGIPSATLVLSAAPRTSRWQASEQPARCMGCRRRHCNFIAAPDPWRGVVLCRLAAGACQHLQPALFAAPAKTPDKLTSRLAQCQDRKP